MWTWVTKINSTVFPEILPQVTFFTLISVVVSVVCEKTGYKLEVNSVMLTIVGTLLSFAVSMRISTAYERYNDGRKAWSTMTLGSRQLAFLVWLHLPPTTLSAPELAKMPEEEMEYEKTKAMIEKKTIINLIEGFAVATKHYLRGESGVLYEDLYYLVACLPKYYFPSAIDINRRDSSHVLGLWRSPHPDGTRLLPIEKRSSRPDGEAFMRSVNSSRTIDTMGTAVASSSASEEDLEKGEANSTKHIELLPKSHPPKPTIFHYCPPLVVFKPLVRWLSPSAKQRHRARKGRNHRPHIDSNIPLEISLFLSGYLDMLIQRQTLPVALIGTLFAALGLLQSSMADLERVLTTPLPFAYSAHLRFSIYIYLLCLPFQTYALLHYLSIVAQVVAATIFLGFYELGVQLEMPFGYDDSDLDLDHFCQLIKEELQEICGHPQPDPKSYIFSSLNQPLGASDPRTAQEILADANADVQGTKKGTRALRTVFAQNFHLVQSGQRIASVKSARAGQGAPTVEVVTL